MNERPFDEHLYVRHYTPPNADWFGLVLPSDKVPTECDGLHEDLTPWSIVPSRENGSRRFGSLKMQVARRQILRGSTPGQWLSSRVAGTSIKQNSFETTTDGQVLYGIAMRFRERQSAELFTALFCHIGPWAEFAEVPFRHPSVTDRQCHFG